MKGLKFAIIGIGILALWFLPGVGLAEKEGETLKLGEVVVTATKTPHLLKDVPVETVVLTSKDIEQSNAQTVSDLLKYTPGLFVRAEDVPGISGWRSQIRGLSLNYGYGLILIDGQRVKGGGMGEAGYGLNQIPLDMIERIEIVKGPTSVLYGSDALAGVVNIITKKPTPSWLSLGTDLTYGSYKTRIGGVHWGSSFGKLGVRMGANREESNRSKYGGREDEYQRNHLFTRLSYNFMENVKLRLGLRWEKRERTYTDEEKIRYSPGLEAAFGDGSSLLVKGYRYRWNFHHFTPGYTERKGDMFYTQVEAQYTKPLGERHLATLGGEFLREKFDYTLARKTVDTRSLFAQDEMDLYLWRPLAVVLGGRLDSHSRFGTEFCPKLSLLYTISARTRIRGSVGRGFKSPTVRQMYYLEPFKHGNWYIESNPNLKPEYSIGYSLNLEEVLAERWLLSLGLFRNSLKDMVSLVETADSINGLPVKTYENVAKAHTQGLELGIKGRLFQGMTALASYTYLDAKDEDTGKRLTYRPERTANLRLLYEIHPLGLGLEVGTQYVGEMYKDSQNTRKIDGHSLTEVKVTKRITKYISFSLEADNIFDSDYGEPERDWPGRTFMGKLRLSL